MRKTPFLLLMLLAGTPAFAQAAPHALNARSTCPSGHRLRHIQYSDTLRGDAYAAEAYFETQGMVPSSGNPSSTPMVGRMRMAFRLDVAETGTPNGRYVVPVKVWAELSLDRVTATLDSLKMEGEIPAFMTAKS
jgi:hypothetical protein